MTLTPPSSDPGPSRPRNARTALPFDLGEWRARVQRRTVPADEAYRRALAVERASHGDRADGTSAGYGVYAVAEDSVLRRTLGPQGEHLTVGRHTQCDLILAADTAISLRHVLVRAWALDDGLSLLSLLDLDSGAGFELADRSRQRAIVASGPLVFCVGETSFVALPRGGPLPDELGQPLVQYSDASSHRVNPHPEVRLAPDGPHPSMPTSRITVVPRSSHFVERGAVRSFAGSGGFEIVLERDGRAAGIRVSEEDVGHGVLIGRDARCVDAGLRTILNDGISRVHALVIRERDGVKLYDLASTNGISDGTRRVRSLRLSDQGTTLYLHGLGPIRMQWRAL